MPRQKLPDEWEYNAHGEACESAEPMHIVYDVNNIPEHGLKSLCSRHDDPDLEKYVDVRVALAVIRNAGADPVYEAAKRVAASHSTGFFDDAKRAERGASLLALTDLIESLEEP